MNTLALALILAATAWACTLVLPTFRAEALREAERERQESQRWMQKYDRSLSH
jgi:hypothetical protein